jgi:hypothetical protein
LFTPSQRATPADHELNSDREQAITMLSKCEVSGCY